MIFTGKNLCWGLFFIKVAALTELKMDFNTDIFWWISRNLEEHLFWRTRSSHQRCSLRKGVLPNFAKFTGNTCARVLFKYNCQPWPPTLVIKRLWHRCFPVNFGKSLGTAFLQNISGSLLLKKICKWLLLHFWKLVRTFFTSFVIFCETKIKGCWNQSRLNKNVSYHKVLGEDRKD